MAELVCCGLQQVGPAVPAQSPLQRETFTINRQGSLSIPSPCCRSARRPRRRESMHGPACRPSRQMGPRPRARRPGHVYILSIYIVSSILVRCLVVTSYL